MFKEQDNWSRVSEGAGRRGGDRKGGWQGLASHEEASANKVMFSRMHFAHFTILSFDIFVEHFVGARHCKI